MKTRIFWRHAEAGFANQDLHRPLTQRGVYQAQQTAQWLKQSGADYPLFGSFALRNIQTAAQFGEFSAQFEGLNPDLPIAQAKIALAAIDAQAAIIVGHMPWIGKIIGELLNTSALALDYSEALWLVETEHGWQIKARFKP